jgi:hypothetical protein
MRRESHVRFCESVGVKLPHATHLIIGFQHESDAQRFRNEMRKRLGELAPSLHPEKTWLIEFGRFAAERRKRRGLGKPETFNFLGFTFICGKTRSGKFQIKRKTRRDRMRAKLREIKVVLRQCMHRPIPEQGKWLGQVVRGYFNYHAVPTNGQALDVFRHHVTAAAQEFQLLPAQNTSGNWVKVVQRIPMRVRVDTADQHHPPLRAGMSVEVDVDTGHARGLPHFLMALLGLQDRRA